MLNLEAAAFVMTQAVVSRQPVGDMEFLSCITLSNYPEGIKSPVGSTNTFPSIAGISLMLSFK